ncbi:MAG: FAD:protein FMN transferase [Pseudomonadota bacterium]
MLRSPLFAAIALPLLATTPAHAAWMSGEEAIMGTSIAVQLWAEDGAKGDAAVRSVFDEMHRIDNLMSTWKDHTELSRINATAAAGPVDISDELCDLIARALTFSEFTGGAFDVTYASVGQLYDYRAGVRPDDSSRTEALKAVGHKLVDLDCDKGVIRYQRDGVKIDLGGIAKGYAVEGAVATLREMGIEHAIVSAGGDSRILGDRRGRPWTVGVRNPRAERGAVVTRLPVVDEAVSTSGDYERFFEADGERYHHILKPGTGKPAGEVISVTVIGPDAVTTDAMSTSVFVLGVTDGLALVESRSDLETIIIDARGKMHFSSGLGAPQTPQ